MKKSAYITFRTDNETKQTLENIASKDDRTLSYVINKILIEYLKSTEEGGEKYGENG